jgi:hypothetical protein
MRTDTTGNKCRAEPSSSLAHAPGEEDGGNEPEPGGGCGEREFGDVFVKVRAIFVRQKNCWHDVWLLETITVEEVSYVWRMRPKIGRSLAVLL